MSTFNSTANVWTENIKNSVTHNLNDLIEMLQTLQKEHGNLPVVYWDQFHFCKYTKPLDVVSVDTTQDEKHLLFGGFHANANDFLAMTDEWNENI